MRMRGEMKQLIALIKTKVGANVGRCEWRYAAGFKNIARQHDENIALEIIAQMQQGRVIPLDHELAINAAHYGLTLKLPLADSIIYATAMKYKAIIWTQDSDFESLANVKFFPKT